MDEYLKYIFIYGIIPGILGLGSWIMRQLFGRIEALEKSLSVKVDEHQVRQILTDRIEPLREDIQEIKVSLNRLVELLLKR